MKDYLWIFILGIVATLASIMFFITISKSSRLVRKTRKNKVTLLINFSLLLVSLVDIGLIIYVFLLVKEQISLLS